MKPHSRNLRNGRVSLRHQMYMVTTTTKDRAVQFLPVARGTLMAKLLANPTNWTGGDALAWVVMPDHLHVLVNLTADDLSATIRGFKGRAAVSFNRATGQHGPLWQPGFHDYAIRKNDLLPAVIGYIAENPLKAGLVTSITDWPLMGGCMLEQWIEQFAIG